MKRDVRDVCRTHTPVGLKLMWIKKAENNRSPKGNMWSATPVALLCMVVNQNKRQGSGPKGDKVL